MCLVTLSKNFFCGLALSVLYKFVDFGYAVDPDRTRCCRSNKRSALLKRSDKSVSVFVNFSQPLFIFILLGFRKHAPSVCSLACATCWSCRGGVCCSVRHSCRRICCNACSRRTRGHRHAVYLCLFGGAELVHLILTGLHPGISLLLFGNRPVVELSQVAAAFCNRPALVLFRKRGEVVCNITPLPVV